MTNEEIVLRYQAGQKDCIDLLWSQCERFIKKKANRWKWSAEFDDLTQQGFLILIDAASDYTPDKDSTFIAYLGYRLEWGWMRWLEETGTAVRLPSFMVQRVQQYERIRKEYAAEHGCEPPEGHICRAMGITQEQLQQIKETVIKSRIRSLNEAVEGLEGDTIELQDVLTDGKDFTDDVLEERQREQLAEVIWPIVDDLEARQAEVIRQRYKKDLTLKETGAGLGVSIERVRQIEQKALRMLRHPKRAQALRPFYENIHSKAIRGVGLTLFNHTWTSATERAALYLIGREERPLMNDDRKT